MRCSVRRSSPHANPSFSVEGEPNRSERQRCRAGESRSWSKSMMKIASRVAIWPGLGFRV